MKTKEELEAMGIDFSAENNNELSATANVEDIESYMNMRTKVYKAFNGNDYVLFIDEIAYGEIQSVKVNTIDKIIELEVVLFGAVAKDVDNTYKEFNKFKNVKNSKMTEVFANEYGYKTHRDITGVTYLGEKSCVNIDSTISSTVHVYKFDEISDYKPGIQPFEIKYSIEEN